MKLERTFRFRGRRDYLHSTSLFDDIRKIRGADARNIDMRFHRRTAHQVSYTDTPPSADDTVVAEWSDDAGKLYVIERDDRIHEHESYDEGALADLLVVDGSPLENIEVLEHPHEKFRVIIKDGVVCKNTLLS